MHAPGWPVFACCVLLALLASGPAIAQAGSAAAPAVRESTADLIAKFTPAQKQAYDDASKAFREGRFKDSLQLHEDLLTQLPGDAVLTKFASEDALNTGDAGLAVTMLRPMTQSDPDDWQAAALLVRACAESGDTACRDAQMAHMTDLQKRGLTPAQLYEYPVENVKVGANTLLIKTSLVPWGRYKVYALGRMNDPAGKLVLTLSLESSDFDQVPFARQHPDEAARGARVFSLDGYLETGTNSDGKRTQTHLTYKFLTGQPDYATIRQEFVNAAGGTTKPVSTRTGLLVP